jgi:hypothetical protein
VWGLSCYPEIKTVGYRFGECHTTCTLKTSFIDFEKEYEHPYTILLTVKLKVNMAVLSLYSPL